MGLSADQIAAADQASGIGQITGIVMLVIALGLYALVYVFLKKGKNWARVLGIVLSILSVVGTLIGLLGAMAYGGLGVVLLVLGLVLVVVNVAALMATTWRSLVVGLCLLVLGGAAVRIAVHDPTSEPVSVRRWVSTPSAGNPPGCAAGSRWSPPTRSATGG